jgi:branched-chain amino acid transport system permease protein
VGAGLLVGIPELLRLLAMPSSVAANVRLLLYGLLLVIFMHFRGRGIAGEYRIE